MDRHAPATKEALIARIDAARAVLTEEIGELRHKLDLPGRVRDSVLSKPLAWFGGSLGAGFLGSMLLRRRRTEKPKRRGVFGFLLGSAFSLARPALQAWAIKELKNRVALPGNALRHRD